MDFFTFFRDLAFPIAVAAYLLFSHGKKLEELRDELNDFRTEVNVKLAVLLDRVGRKPEEA